MTEFEQSRIDLRSYLIGCMVVHMVELEHVAWRVLASLIVYCNLLCVFTVKLDRSRSFPLLLLLLLAAAHHHFCCETAMAYKDQAFLFLLFPVRSG